MIENKKEFFGGAVLMISFVVILILFFLPIWGGKNGLNYLDNLYNSISKGSAYYIPDVKEARDRLQSKPISVTLMMEGKAQAEQTAGQLRKAGVRVVAEEGALKVTGDLGLIVDAVLEDADAMYVNNGGKLLDKYGYDERRVLYNWWTAFKALDKDFKKQKRFKEADLVVLVKKKAIESSYNYYGVEPQRIGERVGTVVFSLVFYVLYTLIYGFAILFMFEGWGLKLAH